MANWIPKKTKYRKPHRISSEGHPKGSTQLAFLPYGIKTIAPCQIKSFQLESARIAMTRYMKKGGKIIFKIFPHTSITKKPLEVRMGAGKGNPEFWVSPVKINTVIIEIGEVSEEIAREAARLAIHKLPVKAKFVIQKGENYG